MGLTRARTLAAISDHSRGLAEEARGNLGARVEHCPEWSVADLVSHVTGVHWFWRTIAEERLTSPPEESRRPPRAPDDELVDTFLAGADALVETLRTADQSAACWTWFPSQQQVAFITRHQVQEVAVHHFDAAHAAGHDSAVDGEVAVDCVEEFLTTSLADAEDVARLGGTLDGELVLVSTDTRQSWTVRQETPTSPLLWAEGGNDATVSGTASDLLLWLYGRVALEESDPALVQRFRALASTT